MIVAHVLTLNAYDGFSFRLCCLSIYLSQKSQKKTIMYRFSVQYDYKYVLVEVFLLSILVSTGYHIYTF